MSFSSVPQKQINNTTATCRFFSKVFVSVWVGGEVENRDNPQTDPRGQNNTQTPPLCGRPNEKKERQHLYSNQPLGMSRRGSRMRMGCLVAIRPPSDFYNLETILTFSGKQVVYFCFELHIRQVMDGV